MDVFYEFKVIALPSLLPALPSTHAEEATALLNDAGREGWQLVSVSGACAYMQRLVTLDAPTPRPEEPSKDAEHDDDKLEPLCGCGCGELVALSSVVYDEMKTLGRHAFAAQHHPDDHETTAGGVFIAAPLRPPRRTR